MADREDSTNRWSVAEPLSIASPIRAHAIPRTTLAGLGRHTLGIFSLLIVVVLWTASSFLASFIFADDTYSKPYFVTYINGAFLGASLLFIPLRKTFSFKHGRFGSNRLRNGRRDGEGLFAGSKPDGDEEEEGQGSRLLGGHDPGTESPSRTLSASGRDLTKSHLQSLPEKMSFPETARLSLEFFLLWFVSNYFVAACLQFTTVASSTILSSTSSIWTLLISTFLRTEKFTIQKLLGVLASLAGIVLISRVDLGAPDNDDSRGDFPHKTSAQIALGDAMALFSALCYGIYSVLMKRRIRDETRVDMPLFLGLVGALTVVLLWPGFLILHIVGEETFELPSTSRIWMVIIVNSITSLVADFAWAYSIALTSPVVVTVGLTLTIPLSLVGQMVLSHQYSGPMYWAGAVIVVCGFVIVNRESSKEEESAQQDVS